jgi:hypothetical protein
LIASAKGTHTPSGPGLFGPLRKWWYPRILRSINVKNATAIKTAINWIIRLTSILIIKSYPPQRP